MAKLSNKEVAEALKRLDQQMFVQRVATTFIIKCLLDAGLVKEQDWQSFKDIDKSGVDKCLLDWVNQFNKIRDKEAEKGEKKAAETNDK